MSSFGQERTFNSKVSVAIYEFVLPEDFQDYAYEVEAKGWFSRACVQYMGRQFPLSFYDPVRLSQQVEDELEKSPVFTEPNLLVVPSVTEAAMRKAVDHAVAAGLLRTFISM